MDVQLEDTKSEDEVIEITDDDEVLYDEPEKIEEPKKKRNYVLTDARKAALQKAREKKTNYAKVGKDLVQKKVKEVPEKIEEPPMEIEESPVIKKPIKQKPAKYQEESDDDIYEKHQRLKEDEIREYLKYKKEEEDEYRRTLMIKSQIEKEQKYKKAFASIFGN